VKVSIRVALYENRGGDVHPLSWAFERGAQLRFDGLELRLQAGPWSSDLAGSWSQQSTDQVKALCQKHEMAIYSLSSDWAWAYASFFPQLTRWDRGVELIADDAKLARELGVHTMLIHFATGKGSGEDCEALRRDVAAAGEDTGIRLGYGTNIWERLGFGGLDSLCRMVDEVGSAQFGVYLHNACPRAGLPLEQEIAVAGPRLVRAMHSSSLVEGRVQIDWEKAFDAIKTHFADGVYTFEVE